MSALGILVALAGCLLVIALVNGAESGLYALSRPRVEAAARAGLSWARTLAGLLRDDARLLIALVVAHNLAVELMGYLGSSLLERPGLIPPVARELVVALLLTPVALFFGELLPKDLCRRRPHAALSVLAFPIAALEKVLLPLVWPLRALTRALERALGIEPQRAPMLFGHDLVLQLVDEGGRTGTLSPRAQALARNVLRLRSIPLASVMVPWTSVERLALEHHQAELYAQIAKSSFTRLPVVDASAAVRGYVHQLEVLGSAELVAEGFRVEDRLRPLDCLAPDLPVDRALTHMRLYGHRMAVVGSLERPVGLVTLKDLVETISGDLERW